MTRNPKLVWAIVAAGLITIVSDLILVLTERHATPLWGSSLVGFWAVFAVFWFLVFVFGSKWMGVLALQQREDFYREESTSGSEGESDSE